jgi:hypothetical protein
VGPRATLDMVAKRSIPCPSQVLNLGHPAYNLVIMLIELSWLPFNPWMINENLFLMIRVNFTG